MFEILKSSQSQWTEKESDKISKVLDDTSWDKKTLLLRRSRTCNFENRSKRA